MKEEIRRDFGRVSPDIVAKASAFDRGYLPGTTTKKGTAMGNLMEKDKGSTAR